MPTELIIFDCDGVLIDSEPLACRVRAEQLTSAGYPITAEEVARRFIGISEADLRATVEAETGRPLFFDRHDRTLMALFARELKAVAGIATVLEELRHAGLRTCVASSSSPEKLEYALGLVGLWPHLQPHVFSTRLVPRGKPAPDIFLYAADVMGVSPARCTVVEDSVAGVRGGTAAGMRVFGFCGGGHCAADHADRLRAAGAAAVYADAGDLGAALVASATGAAMANGGLNG